MCYAIPGKVAELFDNKATIDYFGEKRTVLNEFSLNIGDFVYAQAGVVIQKIETDIATRILESWKEDFMKLKKIDEELAVVDDTVVKDKKILEILKKSDASPINKEDALELLKIRDNDEISLLLQTANKVRQKNLKNSSCIHGIIEFSNYCKNNCSYCGIRKDNLKLKRYRMSEDEIVNLAIYAAKELNFKAIVLQSGEDDFYTTDILVRLIKKIKEKSDVLIILSIGERELDDYAKMYDAGCRGVLIRFETSNPEIYKNIHINGKSDFEKRINLIKNLREMGYLIITGFLIGLPEQTNQIIIEDILFSVNLKPDMYSIGPFIPHSETPLKDSKKIDLESSLKVIAVLRLLDPESKILETTALETLDKLNNGKSGLLSGANSLMINITPMKHKIFYNIYENKAGVEDELKDSIDKTIKLLYSIGRAPTDLGI